jgi:crotonobetainyl-CoA:carnitine CoA-transferase CaiB-like acyl-CoA transferase
MPLLDGLRIISVEQYGAGPFGTLQLADLGAEVIKIEDPSVGGDMARGVPPFAEEGDSLFYQAFNRNKRSVALNLQSEAGRRALHALVAHADAVFSNLRGDQPEKLGITYEQLKPYNPRIVCVSLSGYGTTGPRRKDPAYDYLIQGEIGLMSLTGEPGGPPERAGLSLMDFTGGLVGMIALLAGVMRARATGIGCDVETNLLDAGLSLLNYIAIWTLNRDYTPQRTAHSAHPSLVPSQIFATSDGYIVVMCNKEKFFPLLCQKLGHPEWAEDERFADFAARLENKDVLLPLLDEAFRQRTTADWLADLRGTVPVAPVNDVPAALRVAAERGMLLEVEHPRWGRLREVASPIHPRGVPAPAPVYAGPLGHDTEAVLREIGGLSDADLAALRREGAFQGTATTISRTAAE